MKQIVSRMTMDLIKPMDTPVVYAVQGESNTRKVEITLLCDNTPWLIPENAGLMVRYGRVDMTGGCYDTLPDGNCAYSFAGNVVTVTLVPQMLNNAGLVHAQIEIRYGDNVLCTFSFCLNVSGNPALGIVEPENYINMQNWLKKEMDCYVQQVREKGEVLGGTMAGPINMNGQELWGLISPTQNDHAVNMGYVKQQVRKAAPWNLLDNSDFRNPVNQRGLTIYTNADYTIDRWRTYGSGIVSVVPGGIMLSGSLHQLLEGFKVSADKVYTVCAGFSDGTAVCGSGTFETGFGVADSTTIVWAEVQNDLIRIRLENPYRVFSWVALYEGEYTIETLPEYHPKGYVTELNECRWYYRDQMFYVLRCYANGYLNGVGFEPMRVIPTITVVSTQSMIGDAIEGETTAVPSTSTSLGFIANTNFVKDTYYRIVFTLDADLK